LSGIQPTGVFTLGNMLGAVNQWVELQDAAPNESLFMIVDLHAMTMPYLPKMMPHMCRVQAASMVACGVDPERSAVFRQSAVREHAELQWILACITPLGWLQRMTQFKDKSETIKAKVKRAGGKTGQTGSPTGSPLMKRTANAGLGLLAYPVLQAADVLLYRATDVPVGEDQKQHLELTRDVAAAFNDLFCQDQPADSGFRLPLPDVLLPASAMARVMSLRDGTKKMSKSDPSSLSRISITDSADTINKKIKRAKTDALPGLAYDRETRPERSNLCAIFAAVSGESVEAIVTRFQDQDTLQFKTALAEALVAYLAPIQARMEELLEVDDLEHLESMLAGGDVEGLEARLGAASLIESGRTEVDKVLLRGEAIARAEANQTMEHVRELTGLARA
jgi:tryptophanyl-tRNA synthetase